MIHKQSNKSFLTYIEATGNYNFFNLLTILAAFSCFDDDHLKLFSYGKPQKEESSQKRQGIFLRIFFILMEIAQGIKNKEKIDFKINFLILRLNDKTQC